MRRNPNHWYVFHELPDNLEIRRDSEFMSRLVSDFDSELVLRTERGGVSFYKAQSKRSDVSFGV